MNPSSSCSETGFANSARRSAVVCGEAEEGIRERNCVVWEDGSRAIEGRLDCSFGGSLERFCGGIGAVVLRAGLLGTGRGALLVSSAVPKQQQSPRSLLC